MEQSSQNVNLLESEIQKITDDFYFLNPRKQLGKGSYGIVYKGWCKSKKMYIAVKQLLKIQDKKYQRQITILQGLSKLHRQNIMQCYGSHQDTANKKVYIFTELCQYDLKKAISKGLSQLEILKFFRAIVEGMAQIHARKQMHRDLKPQNILINMKGILKISDFGLARNQQYINITGPNGTPLYSAPQVWNSKPYNLNCDVWNGGLILYEMIKAEQAFDFMNKKKNNYKKQPKWSDLRLQWQLFERGMKRIEYDKTKIFHPLWEYFISIMLTYDPYKRPSYDEILQKLKPVYKKMECQIRDKKLMNPQHPMVQKLKRYLNFEIDKYQILREIYLKLLRKQVQIKKQIRFVIIFLCLSKYLKHMDKLITELSYRSIKLPKSNQQVKIDDQKTDYELIMCMDVYQNKIQTYCTFYHYELRSYVLKELQEEGENLQKINQTNIISLINYVNGGRFDVQQTYDEQLKRFCLQYISIPKQNLSSLNIQTLKAILAILICINLETVFPSQSFQKHNYVSNKLKKIYNSFSGRHLDQIIQFKTLIETLQIQLNDSQKQNAQNN